MPGMSLSFNCPCGFQRDDIWVGATETGHYTVFLCLQCKKIFSIWTSVRKHHNRVCKRCGMKLMAATDSGVWEPASLQQRFTDTEPWMVENDVYELEEPENNYISSIENIRLLCPNCRKYSLTFENTAFWD